ncbi:MAG TPA: hypothetical protein VMV72_17140 [Verrucomicrobiae bacterium]|nr:hypothetical protein [Verrucomicrobiae bacterium]
MKREFLGDSYDAVKRMWREILADWAPLYAEPRFVPDALRHDFTRLTGIPILADGFPDSYSILNDPDTGIWLPDERNRTVNALHVSTAFIADQLRTNGPRCVITFDQSFHRSRNLTRERQRDVKMRQLAEEGFPSFYYESHATFLFAAPDAGTLQAVRKLLIDAGIPRTRLNPQ